MSLILKIPIFKQRQLILINVLCLTNEILDFNLQNSLAYKDRSVSSVIFNVNLPNHIEIIKINKAHEVEKKQLQNTIKQLKTEKSDINRDAIFWKKKYFTLTRNYDHIVEKIFVYEDCHCYAGKNVKVIPAKIDDKTKFSESVRSISLSLQKN